MLHEVGTYILRNYWNISIKFYFFVNAVFAYLVQLCSLQTREELREALEAEMRAFAVDRVRYLCSVCLCSITLPHESTAQ